MRVIIFLLLSSLSFGQINHYSMIAGKKYSTILELTLSIDNIWDSKWGMQTIANDEKATRHKNPLWDGVNPSDRVGRIEILYTDDYTGVANANPRAEFQRDGFNLDYGNEYVISWDDYLDDDYVVETSGTDNLLTLAQTKNASVSSPPIDFGQNNNQYVMTRYIIRAGEASLFKRTSFGDIEADRGSWQHWELQFNVDSVHITNGSYCKLYKNGNLAYSDTIRTFPQTVDTDFYFKIGLYKPDWTGQATAQDSIERFIDNIIMEDVTDVVEDTTDFQ